MEKQYRSYDEAKKFVRPLKLKNYNEWVEYCKSGNKPDDIPSDPWNVYEKEWCGNGLFLGVYDPNLEKRGYRTLHESMTVVHNLNLKNYDEWVEYCKSGEKPSTIPAEPDQVYKNEGWLGWGHWLGTVKKMTPDEEYAKMMKNEFRSFEDAKKFVQKEKFSGRKLHEQYWYNYCRSGNKPDDIPSHPDIVYYEEWKGFADFFDTGKPEYRSFEEAKKFVQSLNLKNMKEWEAYCKSGKKPDDIPATPWAVYKKENILKRKKDPSKVNIDMP